MKKLKRVIYKIQDLENGIKKALGNRLTYILIFLAIVGCYNLGYHIGRLLF